MSINYLSLRNSNLSSFNAITINYSTLAGSTITGSTIASISTISVSTIFNSTINASLVNYSTLVGSTISTVTFRASTIGIGTAPTASQMTVFNGGPAPYTSAPTMTISDGAPITTGTYGMVHLTRPSGVLDYKGYLTFIRNGSTNVHMMGYLQNSDTFGWIETNATSNPMNTLNGIFMDSNGNVGIGVTNPTFRLHVVGTLKSDVFECPAITTTGSLNTSYYITSGFQRIGGIFFTGEIAGAQWQIANIGSFQLGFNINNTGTGGYSTSYTPVITFSNTGAINCGAITLNNKNVPLYLYNLGASNYSAIYADSGGTMTFATGTSGVGTRMTIAPAGAVNVVGGLTCAEVYTNGWFRVNSNNCGLYWEGLGRGITSPEGGSNPYGNICTYMTGRNGWSGYGMTSRHTVMSNGSEVGIYDNNSDWCIHFNNSRKCYIPGNLQVGGTIEGGLTITTTNISGWALDVCAGTASMILGGTAYLLTNLDSGSGFAGIGGFTMGNVGGLSARFQGNLVATGITKYSDYRIKKDIIQIDNKISLEQIRLLEPVSYHYVDHIRNGTIGDYGFIAQDVKKIIPNSIIYEQNYIPNIFDSAIIINKNIIQLNNKQCFTSDMEKIQIICEDNTRLELSITVLSSNSCRIDSEIDVSICFVYGSYVNDMHILKHEMLFTVGISAIKELDKKIVSLEDDNLVLKEQIKTQQSQLDKLLAWATTQGYTP